MAELLGLSYEGDPDVIVSGLATLASAQSSDLSFYHNTAYFSDLKNTHAAVVIISEDAAKDCSANKLLADNPYLAYANVSRLFEDRPARQALIHSTAVIHESAILGGDVSIGPHVNIEANVSIGEGCIIGANCVIGKGSILGDNSTLSPNVSIYSNVSVGTNAIIHSAVVIGSDGFGFARDGEKQIKIAQLGGVTIGDDVEIGAGTTIDRGALENTFIGNGVKIDNQVQIAHNVRIGENSVICGCSAIAGSSSIGKNCIIAGAVGIINHIDIVDGVTVTAMSLVNKSITKKGVYSSGTGLSESAQWKKNIVHFKHLDNLNSRLKSLEIHQGKNKKE